MGSDSRVLRVLKEIVDCRASRVPRVLKVYLAEMVLLVKKDCPDFRDKREIRDFQEEMDFQEHLEMMEVLDSRENLVEEEMGPRETEEYQDYQVLPR